MSVLKNDENNELWMIAVGERRGAEDRTGVLRGCPTKVHLASGLYGRGKIDQLPASRGPGERPALCWHPPPARPLPGGSDLRMQIPLGVGTTGSLPSPFRMGTDTSINNDN